MLRGMSVRALREWCIVTLASKPGRADMAYESLKASAYGDTWARRIPMNIIIEEMVMRAREQDLLREAAQARLVNAAMAHRPRKRDALRAYLCNIFMALWRRLQARAYGR